MHDGILNLFFYFVLTIFRTDLCEMQHGCGVKAPFGRLGVQQLLVVAAGGAYGGGDGARHDGTAQKFPNPNLSIKSFASCALLVHFALCILFSLYVLMGVLLAGLTTPVCRCDAGRYVKVLRRWQAHLPLHVSGVSVSL